MRKGVRDDNRRRGTAPVPRNLQQHENLFFRQQHDDFTASSPGTRGRPPPRLLGAGRSSAENTGNGADAR